MASAPFAGAISALPSPPDSESLYEIVNGEQREIPHMGTLAGMCASVLAQFLGTFGAQHKIGLAGVEVLFRLNPNRPARRPDVAFVRYDRWPTPTIPQDDPPAWEVIPNLAVEVVSPTNSAEEIEDKIQDYFAAGVDLVWVIYPRHRRIYVYESATQNRILVERDDLDGGNVLPGFRLNVGSLFSALTKPT
jgi:Uma2 family endonuclease